MRKVYLSLAVDGSVVEVEGKFHGWFTDNGQLIGIVEDGEGKIHKAVVNAIRFDVSGVSFPK